MLYHIVPDVLKQGGVAAADVIGVGVDFTSCTVLPVKKDGTPLCFLPEYADEPNAYVKLWKHHAAQDKANIITETAEKRGEKWLVRYGGKISSEWVFAKIWQILDESPEVYAAMDRFIEAADWLVWQLTGKETRNSCTVGYKALWHKQEGYPSRVYFAALDPRLENVVEVKTGNGHPAPGEPCGRNHPGNCGKNGTCRRDCGRCRQCGRACMRSRGKDQRGGQDACYYGDVHLSHAAFRKGTGSARCVRICGGRNPSGILWI